MCRRTMALPLYTPGAVRMKEQAVEPTPTALGERGGVMTMAELREAARAFAQAVDMAARGSGDVHERLMPVFCSTATRTPNSPGARAECRCVRRASGPCSPTEMRCPPWWQRCLPRLLRRVAGTRDRSPPAANLCGRTRCRTSHSSETTVPPPRGHHTAPDVGPTPDPHDAAGGGRYARAGGDRETGHRAAWPCHSIARPVKRSLVGHATFSRDCRTRALCLTVCYPFLG